MAAPNELWRKVPGFIGECYEVSNFGRVRSVLRVIRGPKGRTAVRKSRVLQPRVLRTGYAQHILSVDGVRCYRTAHALVASAFIGPADGLHINHLDGNKLNNTPDNLKYCSAAENNKHAGEMNLKPAGAGHHNSVINHEVIEKAKQLRELGWSYLKISKQFGVCRGTISRALQGASYKKDIYVRP